MEAFNGMTIREIYNIIGESNIPWDVPVEFVDGDLRIAQQVKPARQARPPAPGEGEPQGAQESWQRG